MRRTLAMVVSSVLSTASFGFEYNVDDDCCIIAETLSLQAIPT
jgi:hypothetical protein